MLKGAGMVIRIHRLLRGDWFVNPTIGRQAALPVRLLDERCARKLLGDCPKDAFEGAIELRKRFPENAALSGASDLES